MRGARARLVPAGARRGAAAFPRLVPAIDDDVVDVPGRSRAAVGARRTDVTDVRRLSAEKPEIIPARRGAG